MCECVIIRIPPSFTAQPVAPETRPSQAPAKMHSQSGGAEHPGRGVATTDQCQWRPLKARFGGCCRRTRSSSRVDGNNEEPPRGPPKSRIRERVGDQAPPPPLGHRWNCAKCDPNQPPPTAKIGKANEQKNK
ncbi:hypothetical protein LX32DRAFT_115075 [Colletotrichum zoysiae]|uniref:Uncharacterized protein n=1 Tax=Colletotrichum zoysiae TaxID=1216348 RepID=A0AAD9H9V0_9PEZI|nr:hypothetical protein LX32DRAFT_115075 [Colletotrichum zoysiae]